MNSTEDLAKRVQELIDQGRTLAEAMAECKVTVKSSGHRERIEDRVSYIRGLNSIREVRKASKAAFAKRSKAKDQDATNRYGDEIEAAKIRLEELNRIIDAAENPLLKAIELDEEPSGIVQRMVVMYDDLDERLRIELKRHNMTHKLAKQIMNGMPPDEIPVEIQDKLNALGPDYLTIYKTRVSKGDQRCVTLNRTLNFIEGLNKPQNKDVKANGRKGNK